MKVRYRIEQPFDKTTQGQLVGQSGLWQFADLRQLCDR